jgi:two-component system chemotaxis response regulator CheY
MSLCLVVDDSGTIRKAIMTILKKFSFSFAEAENGQVALDACIAEMPTLIMLDWNMPVMSGIEFLIALRKLPDGDLPKVIFCTTENDIGRIQEAIQNGADEYIMKPFTESIIREKLEILGLIECQ